MLGRPIVKGRQSSEVAAGAEHEENRQKPSGLGLLIFFVGDVHRLGG